MAGCYLPPLEFASEEERQAHDREVLASMQRRAAKARAFMKGLKPMSEVTEEEVQEAYLRSLRADAEPEGVELSPERGGLGTVR